MSASQQEPDVFQGLRAPTSPPARFSGQKNTGEESRAVAPAPGPGGAAEASPSSEPGGHLEFMSALAKQLGVADVVEIHLAPVIGQWSQMRAEADRWRAAATSAGKIATELVEPLGRIDAGWEGDNADAFVAYMGRIATAGDDANDAMGTMADALGELADAIERIARTMVDVVLDTADVVSESAMLPLDGAERARTLLGEAQQSTQQLYDSAREILGGFTELCDGVQSDDTGERRVEMDHAFPGERFALADEAPGDPVPDTAVEPASATDPPLDTSAGKSAPEAGVGAGGGAVGSETTVPSPLSGGQQAAAGPAPEQAGPATGANAARAAATGVGAAAPMMGGMMPMMGGGMAGGQAGGQEHRVKPKMTAEPSELFGKPEQVAPPVLGEDAAPPPARKPGPKEDR